MTRCGQRRRTFGEQAGVSIEQVLSEKPAISEFVVAFNQLDAVAFRQAQLVGAAGYEIVCMANTSVVHLSRTVV